MQYVNGMIGLVLLVFAVSQLSSPSDASLLVAYAAGSVLAFLSLQNHINLMMARGLAVLSTTAMFFYFAGFFKFCHVMAADWYMQDTALDVLGLLFAGFAMIPVLSVYSCWMKADCHMHKSRSSSEQAEQAQQGPAPDHAH